MAHIKYQKSIIFASILGVSFLTGCGSGPSGVRGLASDTRSLFQMVNEEKGDVRDLRNYLQQLIVKLSNLTTIGQDRLDKISITDISKTLTMLSQQITSTTGGADVGYLIDNTIYGRIRMSSPFLTQYWTNYMFAPIFTGIVNIQASYLNVTIQYINRIAQSLQPDEVTRLKNSVADAINKLSGYGI